ncbi:MAG: hypothetical protein IIZ44_05810, partial [Muribaculaceae bacterium]|nr:hypothetical protein [Muribaculaceae bacterium]
GRTVVECSVSGFFRVRMVTKEKNPSFFRVEPSNLQPSGAILGCSRARVGGHFSSRKKAKSAIFGKSRKLERRKVKFHCYQHTIIIKQFGLYY